MQKTKRGNKDHEVLIFEDIKDILQKIFDLEKIEKRTIRRHDITYDMFVSIKRVKGGLKGYEFFDFLFNRKILLVELKTPGQYFDLSVMVQVEDIEASYLNYLKRKRRLIDDELDLTLIFTVVTLISKEFIKRCGDRGVVIQSVKGKKGLYVIRRLIDIYILVIDELEYNGIYAVLFKYVSDLKRLITLIPRMKEGLRKERFKELLFSIIEYRPEILSEGRIRKMIPNFSDNRDREDYLKRLIKGFGKKEVIKLYKPEDVIKQYKPEDVIKQYKPEDVIKQYKKLSRKKKQQLIKLLSS